MYLRYSAAGTNEIIVILILILASLEQSQFHIAREFTSKYNNLDTCISCNVAAMRRIDAQLLFYYGYLIAISMHI